MDQQILTDAFELVEDPSDWRAPIDCFVTLNADFEAIRQAIIHFTATTPTFSQPRGVGTPMRVQAAGYRNGPAGP